MKLLMISGDRSLAEGKRGAFYNTLEEFHKYWERIDIICPQIRNSKPEPYTLNPIPFFDNVFIHSSPWPLILQPLWILRKGKQVYEEQKFNLITVHEYPPFYNGIGARLLWNKIKTPYVLEIMHIPGYPKASSLKERFYRTLFRVFIRWDAAKAKAIRVINQKQTPEFLKAAGINENKIRNIPAFYIDLNIFRPLSLPKKYDLIFVGRLAENKGINLFLEAIKSSDFRALIVGDGPLRGEIIRKIRKNGLESRVSISGWAKDSSEVARLINESRVLIMSSSNEGGPRVILEAMACGVPVLATPVGIVPDLINHEESGMIINWDDEDIVKKANQLLGNKELYSRISQAGISIAKEYEKRAAIKNYASQLEKLIR